MPDELKPIFIECSFQKTDLQPLIEEEGGGPGRFKLTGQIVGLGEGAITLAGKVQHADQDNANKRVYTSKLFKERVFGSKTVQWRLNNKMMFGELDHPADGKTSLNRASHIMTKIEEGKSGEILGEAVILNTQAGNNLKAILEVTDMVGASSRGFGKLKGDGKTIDEGTFDFKTVDFVAEPSTRGAYVVPVKEDIEEVRLKEIEDSLTEIKSRFEADKSEDDLVKDAATLAELSAELGSVTDHSLMKARVSEILENVKTIVSSKTETNIGSEEMDPLIEERLKSIEEGQIEDSAAVAQLENIQVKAGMLEECLDEMSNRYNELESQKDEEIAGIQQQLQTSQAREQAAETLLQEQLDSSNGNNDEVSTIQTRLEAAEELLEAFMDRSQEKQEESNELQTRYDVAEHLLDEHLQEENKSEIKEYVDELTAGLKSAVRETLSKQLVKCESKEEVDETYAELAPLARGKSVSRVPLPNEGGPDNEKLLNEESTSGDEFEQLEEESHPEAYQTFKGLRKLSPGMK